MAPRLLFHITGFGPFGGGEVVRNPTQARTMDGRMRMSKQQSVRCAEFLLHAARQELAEALPAAVASGLCPLPAGTALATSVVLTTAARAAALQLAALPLPSTAASPRPLPLPVLADAEPAAPPAHSLRPPLVCVLHLGVHTTAPCFRLERCAWNEATFRCADEAGWCPQAERVASCDDLGRCRATRLPVDALVAALNAAGHPCIASDDPGRCASAQRLALHACTCALLHVRACMHACSRCASRLRVSPPGSCAIMCTTSASRALRLAALQTRALTHTTNQRSPPTRRCGR